MWPPSAQQSPATYSFLQASGGRTTSTRCAPTLASSWALHGITAHCGHNQQTKNVKAQCTGLLCGPVHAAPRWPRAATGSAEMWTQADAAALEPRRSEVFAKGRKRGQPNVLLPIRRAIYRCCAHFTDKIKSCKHEASFSARSRRVVVVDLLLLTRLLPRALSALPRAVRSHSSDPLVMARLVSPIAQQLLSHSPCSRR